MDAELTHFSLRHRVLLLHPRHTHQWRTAIIQADPHTVHIVNGIKGFTEASFVFQSLKASPTPSAAPAMAALTASACSTYRLAIRSEAHSAEEDPYPSPTLPSRIVLPKKKPLKWSTGVAPGEYGGPPTTTKLRKYWGGGDEDPVTATDDFIWNKEFLGRMQQLLHGDQSNPNSVPSLVISTFLPRIYLRL